MPSLCRLQHHVILQCFICIIILNSLTAHTLNEGSELWKSWSTAYEKADLLISKLSIDEKANLTFGTLSTTNGCAGFVPPIERVGFSGLCLHDGPNGVRATDLVNGYPAAVTIGASWNKSLARERGLHMFSEFRRKGVHVALGPAIGAIGRVVSGGRNADSFGVDPYLCGAMGRETVFGARDAGVLPSLKHVIANEQETDRNFVSSLVDDRTLHEMYLWPFQDGIRAGAGSIMCSYNMINDTYACSNARLQNDILRSELGFLGFVVSDWGAQMAFDDASKGLDMAMPTSNRFWARQLASSVHEGTVTGELLDSMARRIIAAWYFAGQDIEYPSPGVGIPVEVSARHRRVNAKDPSSKSILFSSAIEGHVLVKNSNASLPLKMPMALSLFGYDGKAPDSHIPDGSPLGWALGYSSWNLTQMQAFYASNFTAPVPSIAGEGTLIGPGGSAGITPGYISSPYDALSQRAYEDGNDLWWDFHSLTPSVPVGVDACLVFINAAATEAADRPSINDEASNALVHHVADRCENTIVIIHNSWVRLVDDFVDHANVTAIVYAHLPGQESGRALVSLLYGDENFSGKLPYTIAKNETDYGDLLQPARPPNNETSVLRSNFTEGGLVDYRAFRAKDIIPRYEFGYGLSYSTFSYSNIRIQLEVTYNVTNYPSGPIRVGGHADLWDTMAVVAIDIINTSQVAGQEVAQLYISRPDGTLWLRGFDKIALQPGQSKTVEFVLTRRDLSEWDVITQSWRLLRGKVPVYVGASSLDLKLNGSLSI